jgi:class 3 adenylate cyclase/tetratricopeptide (TPR) repeat protein
MKCPSCQFENPDSAKFCNECGSRQQRICPSCSEMNPPNSKFCSQCGYKLQGNEKPSKVDLSIPQSYTPKHLADKILTTRSAIEGERKLVTVLFADIANFTSISEKLDPEEVHQIMDGCFQILMNQIHKYEGTINQFTGDGVMALFGAPVAHEDHALRSCHAALNIQNAMKDYTYKIKQEIGIDFNMRIGINSGLVIVGSIGDDLRMDYTAVGDTTNLCSRMEGIANPGSAVISVNTYGLVRDFFECKSLGKIALKGKETPQDAFELIAVGDVKTRLGASAAKGLTAFVGRNNSLSTLSELFTKVKSGSGQVAGLVGEAGVGKSRLLFEFKSRLDSDEIEYIEGRCIQYGGSIIYKPIIDILKTYFAIEDNDREFIAKKKVIEKVKYLDQMLLSNISPIYEVLSLTVDDEKFNSLEPLQKRDNTFEAIRNLLIRISQNKILLLAIEDLHWIDKISEEFINYLIDWLPKSRILLILPYRPEYTHQWGSKSYYTKVGVAQLGKLSSSELVKSILGGGAIAPELENLILRKASGNPLFMEEYTKALIENGSIKKEKDNCSLNVKQADVLVPNTIQAIIAARIDQLEDGLKRTMQYASVIGRDFAFRILHTITDTREDIKSHLLNLQGLEFIYEKNLFPELEYIFKHALIQEVAYNSLLTKRRKRLHNEIGGAIETIYANKLDELSEMLAYHFSKGEDLEKTYRYLKLSGDKAAKTYSNYDSFRFYRNAIEVLKLMPDSSKNNKRLIELYVLIIDVSLSVGYPENTLDLLLEGEKLAEKLSDSKNITLIRSHIANIYNFEGNVMLSLEYSEKTIAEAEKINDYEVIIPMACQIVITYVWTGQSAKIISLVPKVLKLIDKYDLKNDSMGIIFKPYLILSGYYALAFSYKGEIQKAIALCNKGLTFANDECETADQCFAEFSFGMMYVQQWNFKGIIKHLKECIILAKKINFLPIMAHAKTYIALGFVGIGETKDALSNIEKGVQIQTDLKISGFMSIHYYFSAKIHCFLNDYESAIDAAEKAIALANENNEIQIAASANIWLGRALSRGEIPQREKAIECIKQGIKVHNEIGLTSIVPIGQYFLSDIYNHIGDLQQADANIDKAINSIHEMGIKYWDRKAVKLKNAIFERI